MHLKKCQNENYTIMQPSEYLFYYSAFIDYNNNMSIFKYGLCIFFKVHSCAPLQRHSLSSSVWLVVPGNRLNLNLVARIYRCPIWLPNAFLIVIPGISTFIYSLFLRNHFLSTIPENYHKKFIKDLGSSWSCFLWRNNPGYPGTHVLFV